MRSWSDEDGRRRTKVEVIADDVAPSLRFATASVSRIARSDDDAPFYRWFTGGTLNVAANCLDRHLTERADKVAFHWEGEPGDTLTLTYRDLHDRVCRFANGLAGLGVGRGGRVAIYMGMVPELPIAMLACARLGAAFTVVFGGFSAEALRERMNDFGATVLVTQDEGWRGGKTVPLKNNADDALDGAPGVLHSVVAERTGGNVNWTPGRDVWFHDLEAGASADCPAEPMDAEQMLFVLYTSGSTGKPKGIVHTTGGYLTGAASTHANVFDLRDDDVYWCAADIGWITGHSYIVFGPLANGATSVMYEGAPGHPAQDRLWDIAERYEVGRSGARRARPVAHPPAGQRGRAHQPRGVGVVPRPHRRRRGAHRGHLVADRDGQHHDQPPPRPRHAEAGVRRQDDAGHPRRDRG